MINKHFSLYGRRYYLKLEWLQCLIFITIFILCALLSLWQWQRAQASEQEEIKQQQIAKSSSNQLNLLGYWQEESFLLDNRTHKGKVGYYHLGLFQPEGSANNLLINLGWLAAPVLRSQIPSPELPKNLQSITITNMPLITPIVWTTDHWPSPSHSEWPKRIQSIDSERFSLATGHQIEEGYWVLLSGKGKRIDVHSSSPYLNKHKHLGYALQWLLIALAALIVGIFSSIKEEI